MRKIVLAPNETIAAAWAEFPSGPGWSNRLIYVLIRGGGGVLRTERCGDPNA